MRVAQFHQRAKRFSEAETVLRQAREVEPRNQNALFVLGAVLERQKRFDAAEAVFREALAVQPDFAPALNYLGYMNADRKVKVAEAVTLIEKARRAGPRERRVPRQPRAGRCTARSDLGSGGLPAPRRGQGDGQRGRARPPRRRAGPPGQDGGGARSAGTSAAQGRGRGRRARPGARGREDPRRAGPARGQMNRVPAAALTPRTGAVVRRATLPLHRPAAGLLRGASAFRRRRSRSARARRAHLQRPAARDAGWARAARARDRAAGVPAARRAYGSRCPAPAGCAWWRSRRADRGRCRLPGRARGAHRSRGRGGMEALLGVALTPAEVMDLLVGVAVVASRQQPDRMGTRAAAADRRRACRTARACR